MISWLRQTEGIFTPTLNLPTAYTTTTYQVHIQGETYTPSMCGIATSKTTSSFDAEYWSAGGNSFMIYLCIGF